MFLGKCCTQVTYTKNWQYFRCHGEESALQPEYESTAQAAGSVAAVNTAVKVTNAAQVSNTPAHRGQVLRYSVLLNLIQV